MNWSQRWLDCLFLHFPTPPAAVARVVPPRLEVEAFEGSAWVSYVLFRLKLRPAWLPFVPGLSSLVELNIRTYVRHRGQSGICFLRILADNRLASAAARLLTPLPYTHAHLAYNAPNVVCQMSADPTRRLALKFEQPSHFTAIQRGTLDAWLLERYRLFVGGTQALLAADVEHPPWQASAISPVVSVNTLAADFGLELGTQPAAAHYAPGVAAWFGAFHTVGGRGSRPAAVESQYTVPARPEPRPPVIPARAIARRGGR